MWFSDEFQSEFYGISIDLALSEAENNARVGINLSNNIGFCVNDFIGVETYFGVHDMWSSYLVSTV